MYDKLREIVEKELIDIKEAGLYKEEWELSSPQSAEIKTKGKTVINFCANNYLGLADNPQIIESAKKSLDEQGFGMALR